MNYKELLSFALKGLEAETSSYKETLKSVAAQAFLSYDHPNAKILGERVKQIQDELVKLHDKKTFIIQEMNLS